MAQKATTEKYFRLYAEPTARWILNADARLFDSYQSALSVPVYSEATERIASLTSRVESPLKRLLIVVVNQPTDASQEALQAGQTLIRELQESALTKSSLPGTPITLLGHGSRSRRGVDTLLIDATHSEYCLGEKEGVGRARKMGLDAGLALHRRGLVRSPMLGSSDADAILPPDYFERLEENHPGASGLLFPYQHVSQDGGASSYEMQAVEATFRYYVLGLAHAGSPYAYHSLGSALAVHAEHYEQVRGVPNRQAGEDFYLLSKLSKLAPLKRSVGLPIRLVTRESSRVPFGTGPSLSKATADFRDQGKLLSYHPEVFELLRLFLCAARSLVEDDSLWTSPGGPMGPLPHWELEALKGDSLVRDELVQIFETLGPRLARCPTALHRHRRFHESFDALATLQFIHRAEAASRTRLPLAEALTRAPFFRGDPGLPLPWLEAEENNLSMWIGPPTETENLRSHGRVVRDLP